MDKDINRLKVVLAEKKRTNKLQLIQEINKELYLWAQSLPCQEEDYEDALIFPLSYFDQEVVDDAIVDVQRPWLLFTKPASMNSHILQDFFGEVHNAVII